MSSSTKTKIILAAGVLLVAIIAFLVFAKPQPVYASDASPVMFFYQDACHFCQQQDPILVELAKEGYRVKRMDVHANPSFWTTFKITGTPTFLAKSGERLNGLQNKDTLREFLEKNGARVSTSQNASTN